MKLWKVTTKQFNKKNPLKNPLNKYCYEFVNDIMKLEAS